MAAALAGDECEGIVWIGLLRGRIEPCQPVEQLGDGEVNLAIGVLNELKDLVILVNGENEA